MLQRDYFLRLIQEFFAALAAFLENNKGRDKEAELRDLYRRFVGSYDTLRNLTVEETMCYAREQWPEEQRIQRLEMLAELLYAEALGKAQPLSGMLFGKASHLFHYVNAHDNTFSIERMQKLQYIARVMNTESPS